MKEKIIIDAYLYCTEAIEYYEDASEEQVWQDLLSSKPYYKADQLIHYSLAEGVSLKELLLNDLLQSLKKLESCHDIVGLLKRFQIIA